MFKVLQKGLRVPHVENSRSVEFSFGAEAATDSTTVVWMGTGCAEGVCAECGHVFYV